MVADRESKHLAQQLFAETCATQGIAPDQLTVHMDRGSPMKSDTLAQLFVSLGVARSFSRPRVSDDNAFSESQFKTLKYQLNYPGWFGSLLHARAWLQDSFHWYNEEHHHVGLALFTPADVFHGRVEEVAARRQQALDQAYARHPERFTGGRPTVRLPAPSVHINSPARALAIRSPEPPPEASVRPSPADTTGGRAQGGSRAAQPRVQRGTLDAPEHGRTLHSAVGRQTDPQRNLQLPSHNRKSPNRSHLPSRFGLLSTPRAHCTPVSNREHRRHPGCHRIRHHSSKPSPQPAPTRPRYPLSKLFVSLAPL